MLNDFGNFYLKNNNIFNLLHPFVYFLFKKTTSLLLDVYYVVVLFNMENYL